MKQLAIFRKHGFDSIIVFDGETNPLKAEESNERRSNIPGNLKKLQEAYNNPNDFTVEQVQILRKAVMRPREDIIEIIYRSAIQSNYAVVCAPFEADDQFVALQSQGIIDCVVSTDTDLIGKGIKWVINEFNPAGQIKVMSYDILTTQTLPDVLQCPGRNISISELAVLCCMLGNDNIREGNPGDGFVRTAPKFREYLFQSSFFNKMLWMEEYKRNHATPDKFSKALFSWEHAPAFIITPDDPNVAPRDAYGLGDASGQYSIALGSMDAVVTHQSASFYQPNQYDQKLGFVPHDIINARQMSSSSRVTTYRDFFSLSVYVRTGQPLKPVPPQYNKAGEEVYPGGILSPSVPLKFVATRSLACWLSCRGMNATNLDREDQLKMVNKLVHHEVDALPIGVLRGGGAYVCNSVLEFDNESDMDWKTGEEALVEIRSDKCACIDDDAFVNGEFRNDQNSKRRRILNHLKGGSFDLKDIKVSDNLKSELMRNETFFVIEFSCAPSQKGLGTEGKTYSLRLAFRKLPNCWILMATPYSLCPCPVGVLNHCAHRGACILLVRAIRLHFDSVDFSGLVSRLPPSIHAISKQVAMVHYVYPPAYEKASLVSGKIRKETVKRMAQAAHTSRRLERSSGAVEMTDIDLEDTNEREMKDSSEKLIDLLLNIETWCTEIEVSIEQRGYAHNIDLEQLRQASIDAATINTNPGYKLRQHMRFANQVKSVESGKLPRTMYGYYARHYIKTHGEPQVHGSSRLRDHMKDPYDLIYSKDGDEDNDEDDDEDVDLEYVDELESESDN